MTTLSKRALGQILPGFWIGRMAAVRAIFEMQDANSNNPNDDNQTDVDDQPEEWTLISILSSNSIISAVTDTLEGEQLKGGRRLVTHHEVWDLPDKAHADFVSDRLIEILNIISRSIEMPAAPSSPTSQSTRPRRNCLIHCARGVSRSAAVCAAWLISRGGYTLPESLDLIRITRNVNPNLGFLAGLRAIEKCDGDVQKAQRRLTRKGNKKDKDKNEEEKGRTRVTEASDEVSC